MNKEGWQKPYIQRVLDCHNKRYGTDSAIIDRYEEVYPEAEGKKWDWVAIDKNNSGEVAIEVKRLTTPQLQKRFSELDKICRELSCELSGDLKGTFILSTEVSEEEHFDLKGANKQRIKENLKELILKEAQSLEIGSEKDLTAELRARLPKVLPQAHYFKLHKLDNEGSYLSPSVAVGWWVPNGELQGEDLDKFQRLIQSANQQLAEAEAKGISDIFLIIIEIWFSGVKVDVLQSTLRNFDPSDYPHIKFLYLVGSVYPPNIHELFLGNVNSHQEVSSY